MSILQGFLTVFKTTFRSCSKNIFQSRCRRSISTVQDCITDDIINEFHENGVICLRGVFNKHWLELAETGISRNLREPSKWHDRLVDAESNGVYFNDYNNYKSIPEFNEFVTGSPAAQIAGLLMRSMASYLYGEHVFCKDVGCNKETPWHHDQAYYPINGTQNCTVWLPTRPVSKKASLKFLKSSHKTEKLYLPRLFKNHEGYAVNDETISEQFEDIETSLHNNNFEILQWALEPGDCLVFHMKLIHGTEKSITNEKRVVLATRWFGDDITFCRRPFETSPPMEIHPEDFIKNNSKSGFLKPWSLCYDSDYSLE